MASKGSDNEAFKCCLWKMDLLQEFDMKSESQFGLVIKAPG